MAKPLRPQEGFTRLLGVLLGPQEANLPTAEKRTSSGSTSTQELS